MLTLTLTDTGVLTTLQNSQKLREKSSPFLESIGNQFLSLIDSQFISQTDAFGNAWVPLSLSTVQIKKSSRILYETGKSSKSFTSNVNDSTLEVGSNRFFDDGTNISKHQVGFIGKGNKKKTPARPILPLENDLPQQWDSIIDGAINRLFSSL